MATNATKDETTEAQAEEVKPELSVEEDLDQARKDLEESETTSEEDTQSDESPVVEEEAKAESDTTLTTPQEPEHDLAWYQKAYPESTKEALRLKKENDELKAVQPPPPLPEVQGDLTAEQLYIRGKQMEESDEAFAQIRERYPDLKDKATYDKFVAESRSLGAFIVNDQKRFPSPKELYEKTAIILGLQPDTSEALGVALKDGASAPRVSSGTAKPPVGSKVTDAMVKANRRWYPNKSDAEIREELEPHVQ